MEMYQHKSVQVIPTSLDEAWEFFSSPKNLKLITPEYLNFKITSEIPDKMFVGQIISYTVKPFLRIPLTWVTEITHVDDKKYFVDEQRYGPYKMWHHEHHFEEVENGVKMSDRVSYILPYGILGVIAQDMFVKRQLKGIFDHRKKVVEEVFGTSEYKALK